MNSFYPNGVASWNIIIKHFDTMPSISKLKEHLLSLFRPNIKSTFNIYDHTGLRCIFQLRLRLSPLRSHKWRHNFIETTSNICICNQGTEDNEHFLFSCPLCSCGRSCARRTNFFKMEGEAIDKIQNVK